MTTTTTLKPGRKPMATLADFKTRGLIGQKFGDLTLLAVRRQRGEFGIERTVCIVTCGQGHQTERPWGYLRDNARSRRCPVCKPRKTSSTYRSEQALRKAIAELSPERRRLLDLLLASRRRAPGQEDTDMREMLNDAYAYASEVPDVKSELNELTMTGEHETYGRSASLCSPNWIYAGAE